MIANGWKCSCFGFCGLLLMAGCGSPPTRTAPAEPAPLYQPQDSPAHCLANLETSFDNRDLAAYSALLADDFVFAFSPMDVQNPADPTPGEWGLGTERAQADSLFGSKSVETIDLTFTSGPAVDSGTVYGGTWRVDLTHWNLVVQTVPGSPPVNYQHPAGNGTLFFKEYPSETAGNGRPLWRIWRWEYQPIAFGPQAAPRHKDALLH